MNTDSLIELSTFLLGLIPVTERLVAIVKNLIPWLGKEQLTSSGLVDEHKERYRTLAVHVVAFISAYVTIEFTKEAPIREAQLSSVETYKTWFLAFLSMGGSTLWSNVLGYANAAKDIKKQQRADQRMIVAARAAQQNISIEKFSNQ